MNKEERNSGGGFPFLSILTLVFITLKLTGYIHWSWFWVLSPILIPLMIGVVVFCIGSFLIYRGKKKSEKSLMEFIKKWEGK